MSTVRAGSTAQLTSIEICAGAGGQALGLEWAGFEPLALVEIDRHPCNTLRENRPEWNVIESDIRAFDATRFSGVDLVAGGVPCPPFSKAGKQLGADDERDLFPEALRIVEECKPKIVMLENVPGFLDKIFDEYRESLRLAFKKLGYTVGWQILNASNYGVSQLRPRVVIVAVRLELSEAFVWPTPLDDSPISVGQLLYSHMIERHWQGAEAWRNIANGIAPTIVGGSKKHGGPDLGPTRAKRAWAQLGVDGHGIANEAPSSDFAGMPKLTTKMVAKLQGFPDTWTFTGRKTPAYRQIGNAFPPPVAQAVGIQIRQCLGSVHTVSMAV